MLSIDPDEEDDDEDVPGKSGQQTPVAAGSHTPSGAGTSGQSDTPPKEGAAKEGDTTKPDVPLVDCTVDLTKDIDLEAQEVSGGSDGIETSK